MNKNEHGRRDWSLLIFIVPLGVLIMLIAGQIAIRIMPYWSVDAGMQSNLNPESFFAQPISLFRPLAPQILTPAPWEDDYLTPQDISYPPFFVIAQTASISPIPVSPTQVASQSLTITLTLDPTASRTHMAASTSPLTNTSTSTRTPTKTPTKTLTLTKTLTPSRTPRPSRTPSYTFTTESPTETLTPTPTSTPTGFPSTPDPIWTLVPSDISTSDPDGFASSLPQGTYTIVNFNLSPILVEGSIEPNYDLVYYEMQYQSSGTIRLDSVILGVSKYVDGREYYQIFNWGDGMPDYNSNVWDVTEADNQLIQMIYLYPYPGTGILLDVDNAASEPPPGEYPYLVVISPRKTPSTDSIQVDAVQLVNVPR